MTELLLIVGAVSGIILMYLWGKENEADPFYKDDWPIGGGE